MSDWQHVSSSLFGQSTYLSQTYFLGIHFFESRHKKPVQFSGDVVAIVVTVVGQFSSSIPS